MIVEVNRPPVASVEGAAAGAGKHPAGEYPGAAARASRRPEPLPTSVAWTDIWDDRFAEVCRRHPDLVAVYESPRGRLALLLRQTLVPLGPEHFEWLAETRATARAVIARSAGRRL